MSGIFKPIKPVLDTANGLYSGLLFSTPFYEGAGTTTTELVGNTSLAFSGTNNPTWTTDTGNGIALKFNGTPGSGTTSFVTVSTSKILASLTNSSLFALIKTSTSYTNAGGVSIYAERAASGNDIWKLDIGGNTGLTQQNRLEFIHRDDAGTLTQVLNSSAVTINDGKTHIVGVTKTGTSIVLYLDGASYLTGTLNGNDTMTDTINAYAGGDAGDSNANYDANINQILAWNRALSVAEVSALSSNPWGIFLTSRLNNYASVSSGNGISVNERIR